MNLSSNEQPRKAWQTPLLTEHGSIEKITQSTKNKVFGGGDDVILNNQAILANAS